MKLIVEPKDAFEFSRLIFSVCDNINPFDADEWGIIYDVCNRYLKDSEVLQELGEKINNAFFEMPYKEYLWTCFSDRQDAIAFVRQNDDIKEAVSSQLELSGESLIETSMEQLVAYIYFVTTENEDRVNRVIKYRNPYVSDGITHDRYSVIDDSVFCIRMGKLFN